MEMALAILSLYHRMDLRLRGWCQIDMVQRWMPDGSHYSMTAITFPSFTAAALPRQCVSVCVSRSYVTLNLSPSNQQPSTRRTLLHIFPSCGNRLASVSGRSACVREDAVHSKRLVFEKCMGCLWCAYGSGGRVERSCRWWICQLWVEKWPQVGGWSTLKVKEPWAEVFGSSKGINPQTWQSQFRFQMVVLYFSQKADVSRVTLFKLHFPFRRLADSLWLCHFKSLRATCIDWCWKQSI